MSAPRTLTRREQYLADERKQAEAEAALPPSVEHHFKCSMCGRRDSIYCRGPRTTSRCEICRDDLYNH